MLLIKPKKKRRKKIKTRSHPEKWVCWSKGYDQKAMVLLSGGQDSATCLAWALDKYELVETIGFSYGQRHVVELDCRQTVLSEIVKLSSKWGSRLGTDFVVPLEGINKLSGSALLNKKKIGGEPGKLPNTFIPGRNLLFLTYAAALCYERGIQTIVGGMCETDYSGYPDCRSETINSMQTSLSLGMETSFEIVTPLMHLTKSDTWKLAENLGGNSFVDLIIENTATCYQGDRENRHDWGYGCNNCPACELRRDGYLKYINTLN